MEDSPGQSVYTQLQALARHNPAFVHSLQTIMTQNILAEDTESQAAISLILADQNANSLGKAKSPLLPSPVVKESHSSPPANGNNPQLMNMLFSAFQARLSKQNGGGGSPETGGSPTPPTPPPPVPSPPSQPPQQPPQPTSQGLLSMPPPPPQQMGQYLDPTIHWQIHPAGLPGGVPGLVGQPPLPHQPNQLHNQFIYPHYLPIQSLWSHPMMLPPMGGPPPQLPPPAPPLPAGEPMNRKRKVEELGDIDWKRPRLCTGQ